ncbi:carrier protein (macronuclear) [Tetrahymena thermophila SB210]|uniref:Carrier protein n=1 Tax=Tetrahymena thermophila (strain SB210) TaxID=312017 RepID=Q22ZA6_TETTS|nr:carrier protein [Tetrahymena thermophila SB210]7W5Z_M3 Chain M3, Carrier protein [Tetrahymena thermophila]7W5Z_m3 Chain m3, Carrier protein [Tetrahymena thermophila]8B6H_DU Chain DU, Carrier protein [Tetrahymena thermophila SB210]8B6H_Du Chain Du, Carrier protein [Tetrahymena thermophila SB210]8BQS_DU Chain DU, Carrier protein [Tetrahymena thermophila SB210]8BQS_Du Chain Du, Carrier protein [Tetrahymena thermophila SB210]8GYM_M3 Chain M3, Carrier protein [Tetrahymena thermophila SB210]8G|eukprot:XP_001010660.1 carrier protein [Tetrahymena thermophila SB210]
MANFVIPYLKPVADFWNSLCIDQHQDSLFQFKGQTGSLGTDWTSKYLRSEQDVYNHKYLQYHKRVHEAPELTDVISDNVYRLTLFAGVERVLSVRQAQAILKTQFAGATENISGAFQTVLNGGIFRRGYFRGALLNLLQFCGAPYQSLIWSRNSGITNQVIVSSIFEAFFYPLDTVKTLIYNDVQGKYKGAFHCASQVVQNAGWSRLYAGIFQKLIFNSALIFHLNQVWDGSSQQWASLALVAAAYPLLVLKTRFQVAGTPLALATSNEVLKVNRKTLYAGLVPYLIFNTLFAYEFAAWHSSTAQERVIGGLQNAMKQFSSPAAEQVWSS